MDREGVGGQAGQGGGGTGWGGGRRGVSGSNGACRFLATSHPYSLLGPAAPKEGLITQETFRQVPGFTWRQV